MSCEITLKKRGLRLTPQRWLIVDIIHDGNAHLTAEEIVSRAKSRMPGVNKSTVYRTLDLLEEAGCVFKSEMGDQLVYHHVEKGHYHLVCSKCGKTVDCDETLFTPLERALIQNYSFQIDLKHLVMSGLCGDCRENIAGLSADSCRSLQL